MTIRLKILYVGERYPSAILMAYQRTAAFLDLSPEATAQFKLGGNEIILENFERMPQNPVYTGDLVYSKPMDDKDVYYHIKDNVELKQEYRQFYGRYIPSTDLKHSKHWIYNYFWNASNFKGSMSIDCDSLSICRIWHIMW